MERVVTRRGRSYRVFDDFTAWDFWSVFASSAWEPELDDILTDYLTPESCFVDVGAWVGPVTLIAAGLCQQVCAVEPDPVAFERFNRNVIATAGLDNVVVDLVAVTAVDGTTSIGRKPAGQWGDSMTSILNHEETIDVKAVTMKTLFTKFRIERVGILKMDVEGAEADILQQAGPFLAEQRIPLLVSLHQPLHPDPEWYERTMRAALEPFECRFADDGGSWGTFSSLLATPK